MRLTLESTPADATHWSTRAMAKRSGSEPDHGQPHLAGVCPAAAPGRGLQALQRPAVHRKSPRHRRACTSIRRTGHWSCAWMRKRRFRRSIAASRCCRCAPAKPSAAAPDYLRHGTINLFAALDAKAGTVIGEFHQRHRAAEFRKLS